MTTLARSEIKMNALVNFLRQCRKPLNKASSKQYVDIEVMGATIPKIVHQTYHTKQLPPEIEANIKRMQSENPDWVFKLYDDEDIAQYISTHYPQLKSIYDSMNPSYGAARADFFRYLVMYKEGGVYLDIKSGLSKTLDQITNDIDHYALSNWPRSYPKIMQGMYDQIPNPMGEYQQWHIITVKGHPYLAQVINNVCQNMVNYNPFFHDVGAWGVFNVTGPIAYSVAIYSILNQYPHSYYNDHLELGLEYISISVTDKFAGHHAVFKKKHYTKLKKPIVSVSLPISVGYNLTRPVLPVAIPFIKKILGVKPRN